MQLGLMGQPEEEKPQQLENRHDPHPLGASHPPACRARAGAAWGADGPAVACGSGGPKWAAVSFKSLVFHHLSCFLKILIIIIILLPPHLLLSLPLLPSLLLLQGQSRPAAPSADWPPWLCPLTGVCPRAAVWHLQASACSCAQGVDFLEGSGDQSTHTTPAHRRCVRGPGAAPARAGIGEAQHVQRQAASERSGALTYERNRTEDPGPSGEEQGLLERPP